MRSQQHRRQGGPMLARVGAAALFAIAVSAHSQTITGTIDTSALFSPTNQSSDGATYFNAPYSGPFPAPPVAIGEFDFVIPAGTMIGGASFSGNFGSDSLGSATSEVDLFINQIAVAVCSAACATASQTGDAAWTYMLNAAEWAALSAGKAMLTAVEQGPSQIVLDPTSVSVIFFTAVPEPTELLLLVGGVLPTLLIALRRHQNPRGRG